MYNWIKNLFKKETPLKNIYDYEFPEVAIKRTKDTLNITDLEMEKIQARLKEYFITVKEYKNVEMNNKHVDTLWHEFIICTTEYRKFCDEYIGFFIEHNPYIEEKKLTTKDINTLANKRKTSIKKLY